MIYYHPSTVAFFDDTIPGIVVPDDAVAIGAQTHADLLAGLSQGRRILIDGDDMPTLGELPGGIATTRAAAVAAIRTEARNRILAIASLARQSNDNAVLALRDTVRLSSSAAQYDIAAALARRAAIDAVRDASNAAQLAVADLTATQLAGFDSLTFVRWP